MKWFNSKFPILMYFLLIYLVNSKTNEDEVKNVNPEENSSKNFTSHENNLNPRPQVSSSQPQPSLASYDQCKPKTGTETEENVSSCPSGVLCSKLGGDCLICDFNCSCIYGQSLNISCHPKNGVDCQEPKKFMRKMVCQYCYQTPVWEHNCSGTADCPAISSPRKMFKANCSVRSEVICMGKRNFPKKLPCNWTSGYQWSTALLLSITLGGFGADRFYLGHWQEGIGKLFSFGGLGVWTIIDVILIAIRYLGPANESLYI